MIGLLLHLFVHTSQQSPQPSLENELGPFPICHSHEVMPSGIFLRMLPFLTPSRIHSLQNPQCSALLAFQSHLIQLKLTSRKLLTSHCYLIHYPLSPVAVVDAPTDQTTLEQFSNLGLPQEQRRETRRRRKWPRKHSLVSVLGHQPALEMVSWARESLVVS